jgi:ribosomal protein L12E/L44/L45/RPP1/RPP2
MIGTGRWSRAAAVGTAALALGIALGGCGTVATDDSVEEQVKSQLGTDTADCPTDLQGELGQSIVCSATKGDDAFDVKVTVTSVEGNTINFDIERVGNAPGAAPAAPAAPAPPPSEPGAPASDTAADVAPSDPAATVAGENVAQSVFDQLAANGNRVDQVSCPDLPARVGASQRCTLTSGTETYGVTVTVKTVLGTDVKFDIQVDQTPQ